MGDLYGYNQMWILTNEDEFSVNVCQSSNLKELLNNIHNNYDANLSNFGGYEIITTEHMVVDGPKEFIDRTWKERIFSLPWTPWTPWKKQKSFIPKVPSQEVVIDNIGRRMIMHPAIAHKIKEHVPIRKNSNSGY